MRILILLALLFSLLFGEIGSVSLLEGRASIKRGLEVIDATLGAKIQEKDFIQTDSNSKLKITFIDNAIITIGKNSTLDVSSYIYDIQNPSNNKTEFAIAKGAFHAITGEVAKINPSKFKLKTKNATIGIRGTEVYGNQERVFCTYGAISVDSFGVSVDIDAGRFVEVFDDKTPSSPRVIENSDFGNINAQLSTTSQDSINSYDNPSTPSATPPQPPSAENSIDSLNQWGYWASEVQNENNSAQIDDVVGITDPSYIQSLINSSSIVNLYFSGSITPSQDVGAITQNSINFDFSFGGGTNTVNGGYDFVSTAFSGSDSFSGSVTKDGFSATQNYNPSANNSVSLDGKFYGKEIDRVAGNISIDNGSSVLMSGTFSATR